MPRKRKTSAGRTDEASLDDLQPPVEAGPILSNHVGNFDNHRLNAVAPGIGDRPELDPPEDEPDRLAADTADEDEELPTDSDEAGDGDEDAGPGEEDLDAGEPPDSEGPPGSRADLARVLQDTRRQVDRLTATLSNQTRELEFLRQAGTAAPTAQPAANPLDSVPLPFTVTEDDVQALMQGGPTAVQVFNRALQLTAAATARHTAGVLAQAYEVNESTKATGNVLAERFYADNPDLRPYTEILQGQANQVWRDMPYATPEAKMTEVGHRTRERLRVLGISVPTRQTGRRGRKRSQESERRAQAEAGARIRPAEMEMGRRGRANGTTRLTPMQREMYELIPQ